MTRQRGFTLLEVVVSVALFALAMALAYGGLQSVLRARGQLDVEAQRWSELQFAVGMLERDLRSALPRPVRDADGRSLPALWLEPGRIELSRGGYGNSLALDRAELQRVAWQLGQGQLLRLPMASLDRGPGTQPEPRPVLADVARWEVEALADDGRWSRRWPLPGGGADRLPRAVRVKLELTGIGEIERLFELVEGVPQ